MQIKTVTVGDIGENAYVIETDDQVILIDPGADCERIEAAMNAKPCRHVLLTHAHYDHIGAVAHFQKAGAKVYLHADDYKLLTGDGNLARLFGSSLDPFTPDVPVHDGDVLDLAGIRLTVLSTPGHTDGSVCYIADDVIFSGDTLFYLSVGRTDFPSGSGAKLRDSLRNKLFALQGEYKVLPGHDRSTCLSFERQNNPYA